MADTDSASPWAGLQPFIAAALKAANSPTTAQQIAQSLLMKPIQQAAKSASKGSIPSPFGANGLVGGPMAAVSPGPMQATSQGPLSTPAIGTPGALAPSNMQAAPFTPSAAAGFVQMAKPSSPSLGMPSFTSSSPMTADHFTTGTPNPTGYR